jgi:predicted transporter
VLAVPAAAWAGAGHEWFLADCDAWDCGDRARAWFLLVLLTAPLIPVGAALAGGWRARRGALSGVLAFVCMLGTALFGLIGFALLVAATGVTQSGDEASALWLAVGVYFLVVAALLVAVRRRLRRRYPSGEWPPSGR